MIIVFLIFIGLATGSFACALVWRTYKISTAKSKKAKKELSIVHGRSMCLSCKHELGAKDLVPLLSWLALKGKCRYCNKPIGYMEPVVEALQAVLVVASYLFWPYEFTDLGILMFCVWIVVLTLFVALAVYDIRWRQLPDNIVRIVTVVVGVLVVLINMQQQNLVNGLAYSLVAGVVFFGIFYGLFEISKGTWIGGGDVKLAFGLGLLAGSLPNVFLLMFVASVAGTLWSIPQLLKSTNKSRIEIPFGPFLIAASVFVFFFGQPVLEAYIRTLTV